MTPLGQFLLEPPLAAITAAGPLGYVSVSFVDPGIFAHSSWQN